MQIKVKEVDEMVNDLISKGRDMLREKQSNIEVDENLVIEDLNTVLQLSPAMQEELGGQPFHENWIRKIHKQYNSEKISGKVKRTYVLKDEIRRAAKTAKSYSDIFNSINPLTDETNNA